jgi:hypothetical protein
VKLDPITQLILFALGLLLVSDVIGIASWLPWLARADAAGRQGPEFRTIYLTGAIGGIAVSFRGIAVALTLVGLAVWIEILSRWAAALKARRLARNLKLAGKPT